MLSFSTYLKSINGLILRNLAAGFYIKWTAIRLVGEISIWRPYRRRAAARVHGETVAGQPGVKGVANEMHAAAELEQNKRFAAPSTPFLQIEIQTKIQTRNLEEGTDPGMRDKA